MPARGGVLARHKSQSQNLIAETFHHFCHILLVRIMSLSSVGTQEEKITQKCECQEAGSHWEPCKLPTRIPKAIFGKLSRNEIASATIIPFTILD